MNRANFQDILRRTIAAVLIVTLSSFTAIAQSNGNGGPAPIDPQQLAQLRAKIDQQRQANMARLRDRARDLQGPTVIDDVAFPQQTLAGLILVRDVYIMQLQAFIKQAQQWKTLTRPQKREVIRALDEYNFTFRTTGSVATPPKGIQKCDEISRLHLQLATKFQPLLSVGPTGMFSSTFSDVLFDSSGKSADQLVDTFDQYLDYGIQGARDEIWRVQPINTVEGISEFLSPQYQNTWVAAANLYGNYTRTLISSLPEFAATYQEVRHAQKQVKRLKMAAVVGTICIVAMAAAPVAYLAGGQALVATGSAVGSTINLGATAFQLAYDGSEFYGIYSELSNAQKGGAALETQNSGLKLQAYIAGAGVVLDGFFVGMAANDFKNAMQGLKVVPGAAGGATGPADASGTQVARQGADTQTDLVRLTADAGASAATAEGQALPTGVLQGIQRARSLKISENEIQAALGTMQRVGSNARQYNDVLAAADTELLFHEIGRLQNLQAEALAAGVPRNLIAAANARAQGAIRNQLLAFGRRLPAELRVLTARAKGAVIVVAPDEMAEFQALVGTAAQGVVQQPTGPLSLIAGKLKLMRMGRRTYWSADEISLLRQVLNSPNRARLYTFSEGEDWSLSLTRLFNEEDLQTAQQFFNAGDRVAISRGQATLSQATQQAAEETLPLFAPTELTNPVTGQWLTPAEVRALTPAQIQGINPEIVQSLNEGPLKAALRERLMGEATANLTPNPAICPPPQIGPAQISWAMRTLFVLGGGAATADVPQNQLPNESAFANGPSSMGGKESLLLVDEPAGQTQADSGTTGGNSGSGNGSSTGSTNNTTKSDGAGPTNGNAVNSGRSTQGGRRGNKSEDGAGASTKTANSSGTGDRTSKPPDKTPSGADNNGASGAGGSDGANAVGAGAGTPELPPCKKSDSECTELSRIATQKLYAADEAARQLAQADIDDGAANSEDRSANNDWQTSFQYNRQEDAYLDDARLDEAQANKDYSSKATKDMMQQAAAELRAKAKEAAGMAAQYRTKAAAHEKKAEELRAEAKAIRANAAAAKAAAEAAVKAYHDCMNRPPCPEGATVLPGKNAIGTGANSGGSGKEPDKAAGGASGVSGGGDNSQQIPGFPGGKGGSGIPGESPNNSGTTPPKGNDGASGASIGTGKTGTTSNDIPVPPGYQVFTDPVTGRAVIGLKPDVYYGPGYHSYIDPDTGKERTVDGNGPENVWGQPIGWWGVDPQTGKLTWHPRENPPVAPPGRWVPTNGGFRFLPATPLAPNQTKTIRVKFTNECARPQTFDVTGEGFPDGMVQAHGSVTVGASSTAEYYLAINTAGLKGQYDGTIAVIRTSSDASCEQNRQEFPVSFFVSDQGNVVALGQDVHEGDYTSMDRLVREHLASKAIDPSDWKVMNKNTDGSLTYGSSQGKTFNAKFSNGQVVIE